MGERNSTDTDAANASVRAAIPYTVLGGYLGAGKTTLLNRLLSDNQGLRIGLLINDFGAVNIDAGLIETQTDQQINLTNGCVCCGLSDGFDTAIETLLHSDTPPEHIVVEASGVADVKSLAQYGRAPGLSLDAVVVVADAQHVRNKASDKYVAKTVTRQLQSADLLILNKVDLIDEPALEDVRRWLRDLTDATPVVETQFCALPQALLLGQIESHRPPSRSAPPVASEPHNHTEAYDTWHFTTQRILTAEEVTQLLAGFPEDLLRGKGIFVTRDGLLSWHRVGREERLTPVHTREHAGNPRETTLVAIGLRDQFNAAALTAACEAFK